MSSEPLPPALARFGLPDRYRIRRRIATGGMASVWCADDLLLHRSVAVKILAERFAHDRVAAARFTREARAAARVSGHPHVVTVYDVGDLEPPAGDHPSLADGRAFIVMEFLAGGTVADAIRHDAVRRPDALRWLREAASALDHAHANGIVHRDIKPANFLLDTARTLHVADFGIARLTSEETITSSDQLFGTAAYISPEQARGEEAGSASDRYALAVVAFELLAGERPFSSPHFSGQARQHIEESPPAASAIDASLPAAVDDVLHAGLAKRPAERPASAMAFVTALEDALRGRTGASPPTAARRAGGVGGPRAVDPGAPPASTAAARRHAPRGPRARRMSGPPAGVPGRRRIVAFGAIAAAVLVIAAVVVAAAHSPGRRNAGARTADRDATGATDASHTSGRSSTGARHAATRHTPARSSRTATTRTTTAVTLETTGHRELLAGQYQTAIPTLEQAVSAAPPDTTVYAYALYDLGRADVMSGDPQAAIPILRERLELPTQRGVVRVLLNQAIADAGSTTTSSATSTTTTSSSSTTTNPSGGAAPTTPTQPTPTTPVPVGPGAHGGHGGHGGGSGGAGLPGAGPSAPNGTSATAILAVIG